MENRIATLLRDGEAAARAGHKAAARRKFRAVLALDPANVTALLWMAWLNDDPRASLAYVDRALTFEPHNPQARAALRWARRRVTSPAPPEPPPVAPAASPPHRWRRPALVAAVAVGLLIVLIGSTLVSLWSIDLPVLAALALPSSQAQFQPQPQRRLLLSVPHPPTPLARHLPTLSLPPPSPRSPPPPPLARQPRLPLPLPRRRFLSCPPRRRSRRP